MVTFCGKIPEIAGKPFWVISSQAQPKFFKTEAKKVQRL